MPRGIGIAPYQYGPAVRERAVSSTALIGPSFVIAQPTVAGTATYRVFDNNAPKQFRVIYAWGVMTGAGAAADTVVINDGATAITNTADVSTLSDQDVFDFTQINDAEHTILKNGSLRVVTASDALCIVYIECMWTE